MSVVVPFLKIKTSKIEYGPRVSQVSTVPVVIYNTMMVIQVNKGRIAWKRYIKGNTRLC